MEKFPIKKKWTLYRDGITPINIMRSGGGCRASSRQLFRTTTSQWRGRNKKAHKITYPGGYFYADFRLTAAGISHVPAPRVSKGGGGISHKQANPGCAPLSEDYFICKAQRQAREKDRKGSQMSPDFPLYSHSPLYIAPFSFSRIKLMYRTNLPGERQRGDEQRNMDLEGRGLEIKKKKPSGKKVSIMLKYKSEPYRILGR